MKLFDEIDRSLASSARFLIARQSPDGAWRSDTYGAFKDGGSLTPWTLHSLCALPFTEEIATTLRKGSDYLAAMVRDEGTIAAGPWGLSYPVYTSAGAVMVLSQECNTHLHPARDRWLTFLRSRQLIEALGWHPDDLDYGGWGYSQELPRKPAPHEALPPLVPSNLSATTFALDALRAAGVDDNDSVYSKALMFVQQCQNLDCEYPDADFDDGGFFHMPNDFDRNKAGIAGTDRTGRERYLSYGSMTADGLRCLRACGLSRDDPRVTAACHWLEKNFSVSTHPGTRAPGREGTRQAVYYYYCWSLALALSRMGMENVQTLTDPVRWADVLCAELMKRQREDGSWSNPDVTVREDDPIVATVLAMPALCRCRAVLSAGHE